MIRIGIAQVPQTTSIDRNLDKALEYIEKAKSRGVDIICFPETHLPGYRVGVLAPDDPCEADSLGRALDGIRAVCARHAIGVIIGTETPNPEGKPFNSAAVIDRTGEIAALHHKSKLTPLDAKGYAQPDTGPTSFTFDGVPMGITICFEAYRFPENVRGLARNGAKVVFHPQFNHVMPDMRWKLPVHEALITARAAENTVWFVSANMCHPCNNCRSMIVAPDGLIKAASVLTVESLVVADIDPDAATHAFLGLDPEDAARALGEIPGGHGG